MKRKFKFNSRSIRSWVRLMDSSCLVRLGVCSNRTYQQISSFTCDWANRHGGAARCIMRGVQLSMLLALPSRAWYELCFPVSSQIPQVQWGRLPHLMCSLPSPQHRAELGYFYHPVLVDCFFVDVLVIVAKQPGHLLFKVVGHIVLMMSKSHIHFNILNVLYQVPGTDGTCTGTYDTGMSFDGTCTR